ncbi:MAG: hypothetical protein ACI35O_10315 [Bacillaceae bacterium]
MSIIRKTGIKLTKEELDLLTFDIYKHIDYTRSKAYGIGYDQGKFDCKMDALYENVYKKENK